MRTDRIAPMRPVSARIYVDAPREDVFDLLTDLAARPAFMDHMLEGYQLLREQPVGVGAGARFRLDAAGGWMDSVILEADRPHRLVERGRGGALNRVPNVTEWVLTDAPGRSGCEVAATFWTEPSVLVDRLRDLRHSERRLGRGLRRALERLRALAESGEEPHRIVVAGGDRLGV
jgi:uncharacterized protein YndB with AHSA1/START domain